MRELSLRGIFELYSRPVGVVALRSLQGLRALTELRKLMLEMHGLWGEAVEVAAAKGWADGWAPRLQEFHLIMQDGGPGDASVMAALLKLPFSGRLERLRVDARGQVTPKQFERFAKKCTAAFCGLRRLEFTANQSGHKPNRK